MITLLSVSWSWWQISLLVLVIIGIVMMAFALMLFCGVKELERRNKKALKEPPYIPDMPK